jgi:hypothetical protein
MGKPKAKEWVVDAGGNKVRRFPLHFFHCSSVVHSKLTSLIHTCVMQCVFRPKSRCGAPLHRMIMRMNGQTTHHSLPMPVAERIVSATFLLKSIHAKFTQNSRKIHANSRKFTRDRVHVPNVSEHAASGDGPRSPLLASPTASCCWTHQQHLPFLQRACTTDQLTWASTSCCWTHQQPRPCLQ